MLVPVTVVVPVAGGVTRVTPVNGPPVAPTVVSMVTGCPATVVTAARGWPAGTGRAVIVIDTVAGAEVPPGPVAV
ncbi:hypothetical protein D3C81_1612880 [compost metagenome]